MNRINNSQSCIACARRSAGLAVGRPKRLGWFCKECGSQIARIAISQNLDPVEQRACAKVAEKAGADPITLKPEELPAFIAWAVKEFAEAMRKDLDEGGAPF